MKILKVLWPLCSLLLLIFGGPQLQSCIQDKNSCDTCIDSRKPNIYLYPQEELNLKVKVNFPRGGQITTSIPEYGKCWNVSVDPTGLIDEQYSYLFYESKQPEVWQLELGWTVPKNELTPFFRDNLKQYGFQGQEIEDFLEYWIPLLIDYETYRVYPQTSEIIDQVIELDFSKKPDRLLRLFYFFEGTNSAEKLEAPEVRSFERNDGFVVVEWGGMYE